MMGRVWADFKGMEKRPQRTGQNGENNMGMKGMEWPKNKKPIGIQIK